MQHFRKETLLELIREKEKPCLSLYMPLKTGSEFKQNTIRLKNMLRQAEKHLHDTGMRKTEVDKFLEPLHEVLETYPLREYQGGGLAAFSSPGKSRYFRFPINFEERLYVGARFHIKPLIPIITDNGKYYLLVLSLNESRLFLGTRYSIHQVGIKGMPEGIGDILKYYDEEKQIQQHTSGGTGAVFHGQGTFKENEKNIIREYFHRVNDSIRDETAGENIPLVIACVEYLFPIYRETNDYACLMDRFIHGNPDDMEEAQLCEKAWEIAKAHFEKAREEAAANYGDLKGTDKASADILEIVPAAFYKRIEHLFIKQNTQVNGVFNPQDGSLSLGENKQPESEDLLDMAAACTFAAGGRVYLCEPHNMPEDAAAAAVFRYQLS